MLKLRLALGYVCSRCGEYFDSTMLEDRRIAAALFGSTDQVCPICFSIPADREGRDLPPEDEI